ncbi:MAG: DUF4432 family protein [Mycobacteriales bacterium]
MTPAGIEPLRLESEAIAIDVLPGNGADIYAIIDKATGVDVMFKTPWGLRDPRGLPPRADSEVAWLERYGGGWQVLCPNAGDEQTVAGVTRGYHGEASILPWTVHRADRSCVEMSVELFTAPITMHRVIDVNGPTVRIVESLRNRSESPTTAVWGHHPAFGLPLTGPACRIDTGARAVLADICAPGTELVAGSKHTWPIATTVAGEPLDLSRAPAAGDRREIMAYLSDFAAPFYALSNHELGFGVGMRWSADVFPYAWLWQEIHCSQGFPWFGRAHAIAIEPSTVVGGHGEEALRRRGPGVVLEPGATVEATIEVARYDVPAPVEATGIDPGGNVHFA